MRPRKNALRQSNSMKDTTFNREQPLVSAQVERKYSLDTIYDGVPQSQTLKAPTPPLEEERGVEVAINHSPRAGVTIGAKTPDGRKKSETDDATASTVDEEHDIVSETHSKDMIH